MKKTILTIVALSALTFQASSTVCQELTESADQIISYGLELDFTSRYIWHGIEQSSGPVLQPWPWISTYGFTLSVWGTKGVTRDDDADDFEAILDYEYSWGDFTVAPNLQWYIYPTEENSGELTVKLAYQLSIASVFTNQSVFLWGYPGDYFGDIGLELGHEFSDAFDVKLTAALGWASASFNETNLEVSKATINSVCVDIVATYYLLEFLYLYPHVGLTTIIDKDLQSSPYISEPTIVHGGLALGVEF